MAWSEAIGYALLAVTLLRARSTRERMRRLAGEEPILMCPGCQIQARHLQDSLLWLEYAGPVFAGFLWLGEAMPLRPAISRLRRLTGQEPIPRCIGPRCVAHPRHGQSRGET